MTKVMMDQLLEQDFIRVTEQAAIAALNGPEEEMRRMNASFRQRHDFFVAGLNALPGFQ